MVERERGRERVAGEAGVVLREGVLRVAEEAAGGAVGVG